MAEHHITCERCTGPYTAARSDAKQCPACRLLRVLTYAAKKCHPRKCRACGELYAPARIRDRLCGTCDTGTPNAPIVTCAICKRDAPKYERAHVCVRCVKGIESQPVVIRALQKGQAARKQANRDNPRPVP